MSTLEQKKYKSLNTIILRFEYIMFWRRSLGSNIYLTWTNYTDSGKEYKTKVEEINATVKSSSSEIISYFTKSEGILLENVEEQIYNMNQSLSGRIEQVKT